MKEFKEKAPKAVQKALCDHLKSKYKTLCLKINCEQQVGSPLYTVDKM